MFNSGKLIAEVEKRPCLWDKYSPDFDCRIIKSMHWNEIADCMYPDWKTLGKEEKRLKGKRLLQKWRNLKDSYRKRLKKSCTNYVYGKKLEFLRPNLEDDFAKSDDDRDKIAVKKRKHDTLENDNKMNNKKPKTFVENDRTHERNEDKNEDKMFFSSLVPTIQHMSVLTKIKTKIEIMQVIQKNMHEDSIKKETSTLYEREMRNSTDSVDIDDVMLPKIESNSEDDSDLDNLNSKDMEMKALNVKIETND